MVHFVSDRVTYRGSVPTGPSRLPGKDFSHSALPKARAEASTNAAVTSALMSGKSPRQIAQTSGVPLDAVVASMGVLAQTGSLSGQGLTVKRPAGADEAIEVSYGNGETYRVSDEPDHGGYEVEAQVNGVTVTVAVDDQGQRTLWYEVQAGDTLSGIGAKFDQDWASELSQLAGNRVFFEAPRDPDLIRPGERVQIGTGDGAGDGQADGSKAPAIVDAEGQVDASAVVAAMQGGWSLNRIALDNGLTLEALLAQPGLEVDAPKPAKGGSDVSQTTVTQTKREGDSVTVTSVTEYYDYQHDSYYTKTEVSRHGIVRGDGGGATGPAQVSFTPVRDGMGRKVSHATDAESGVETTTYVDDLGTGTVVEETALGSGSQLEVTRSADGTLVSVVRIEPGGQRTVLIGETGARQEQAEQARRGIFEENKSVDAVAAELDVTAVELLAMLEASGVQVERSEASHGNGYVEHTELADPRSNTLVLEINDTRHGTSNRRVIEADETFEVDVADPQDGGTTRIELSGAEGYLRSEAGKADKAADETIASLQDQIRDAQKRDPDAVPSLRAKLADARIDAEKAAAKVEELAARMEQVEIDDLLTQAYAKAQDTAVGTAAHEQANAALEEGISLVALSALNVKAKGAHVAYLEARQEWREREAAVAVADRTLQDFFQDYKRQAIWGTTDQAAITAMKQRGEQAGAPTVENGNFDTLAQEDAYYWELFEDSWDGLVENHPEHLNRDEAAAWERYDAASDAQMQATLDVSDATAAMADADLAAMRGTAGRLQDLKEQWLQANPNADPANCPYQAPLEELKNSAGETHYVDLTGKVFDSLQAFLDDNQQFRDSGLLVMAKGLDTQKREGRTIVYEAVQANNTSVWEGIIDPVVGGAAVLAGLLSPVAPVLLGVALLGAGYSISRTVMRQVDHLRTGGSWSDGQSIQNMIDFGAMLLPLAATGLRAAAMSGKPILSGDLWRMASATKAVGGKSMGSRMSTWQAIRATTGLTGAPLKLAADDLMSLYSMPNRIAHGFDTAGIAVNVPLTLQSAGELSVAFQDMSGIELTSALVDLADGTLGTVLSARDIFENNPIKSHKANQLPDSGAGRITNLTKTEVTAISIEELDGNKLHPTQVPWLTDEQVAGLTRDQWSSFTVNHIEALTRRQIKAMKPEQFGWFDPGQFRKFTLEQFEWMSTEQANALSVLQLTTFRATHKKMMTSDQRFLVDAALVVSRTREIQLALDTFGTMAGSSYMLWSSLPTQWTATASAVAFGVRGLVFGAQAAFPRATANHKPFGRFLNALSGATFVVAAPGAVTGMVSGKELVVNSTFTLGNVIYGTKAIMQSSTGRPVIRNLAEHLAGPGYLLGCAIYTLHSWPTPLSTTAGAMFTFGCAEFWASAIRTDRLNRRPVPRTDLEIAAAQKSDERWSKVDRWSLGITFGVGMLLFSLDGLTPQPDEEDNKSDEDPHK